MKALVFGILVLVAGTASACDFGGFAAPESFGYGGGFEQFQTFQTFSVPVVRERFITRQFVTQDQFSFGGGCGGGFRSQPAVFANDFGYGGFRRAPFIVARRPLFFGPRVRLGLGLNLGIN